MNIEEFRAKRKERLEKLHEALSNMPDTTSDKVQGVVDVNVLNDIELTKSIDKERKERFKDKNKETRQFIKDQDKATEASEEDKAEKRLMLDESLFTEDLNVRNYSDMLYDMIDEGLVDAEEIAKDLIYWCSEEDIEHFMRVRDLIFDEEEEEDESLKESMCDYDEMIKNWDETVNFMDDDIREKLHNEMSPCSREEFLKRYIEEHFKKYGEEFCI